MPPENENIPRTMLGFTGFIFRKIIAQRKWILLPVWLLLAAIALAILVGGASTLLPVIYIAM